MYEFKIQIPEDVGLDVSSISPEKWQLMFNNFMREKMEEIRRVDKIVAKSKATEKDVEEISAIIRKNMAEEFRKA